MYEDEVCHKDREQDISEGKMKRNTTTGSVNGRSGWTDSKHSDSKMKG